MAAWTANARNTKNIGNYPVRGCVWDVSRRDVGCVAATPWNRRRGL